MTVQAVIKASSSSASHCARLPAGSGGTACCAIGFLQQQEEPLATPGGGSYGEGGALCFGCAAAGCGRGCGLWTDILPEGGGFCAGCRDAEAT